MVAEVFGHPLSTVYAYYISPSFCFLFQRLLKDTFDEHAYSKQRHLDEQGLTTDRASIRNVSML